jgi:uncharacterized protein (DUF342 family)
MSDELQRLRERYLKGEITKKEYDERVRDILGIGYSRADMVAGIQAGGLAVLERECNREIRQLEYELRMGIISHPEFVQQYKKLKEKHRKWKEEIDEIHRKAWDDI